MLQKHLGVQPSELDKLPFFEVQYMIEDLHEHLEAEAKENARQAAEADKNRPKMPKAPPKRK